MVRSLGLMFTFAVSICLVGCGGNEGTNIMENEDQADIQAYEDSLADEEGMMDEDFEEEK